MTARAPLTFPTGSLISKLLQVPEVLRLSSSQLANIANAQANRCRYHYEHTGERENLGWPDAVCQQACQDKSTRQCGCHPQLRYAADAAQYVVRHLLLLECTPEDCKNCQASADHG